MEFIAIGKCLKVWKDNTGFNYHLHFKGVFRGSNIKLIHLEGLENSQELWKNREYIVHAKLKSETSRTLHAKIIRIKSIDLIKSDFL